MHSKRTAVWVTALVALSSAVQAQATRPATAAGWEAFTRTFDAWADSDRVVGAAVVLVKNGRVIARHEHGLANRESGKKIDDRSLFHYGSITKTLTATAIMQLRDRGLLSLDDRVTRWVPELRLVHDPFGSVDSVTIRMLLSHSGGFQNPTWPYADGKPWEPFEPTTWNQLVAMMPYQEVHFKPGSKYSYSNPGFIYLARIIESITGDPWETYIQKNIFAPLGLSRSYFGVTPYYLQADRPNNYNVVADSARGAEVVRDNGREFDPGITIPNGGWNAPLDDLARYVAFLTNSASDPEQQARYTVVLRRSSLEEMWRPFLVTGAPAAGDSIGLSFFTVRHAGGRLVGHTGSQAGFLSFLYVNPETSTGIVVAFNTLNELRQRPRSGFGMVQEAALALIR